jgi:DNA polymerase-4
MEHFSNRRTIFHIDMDAFFASIEVVKNPALRGKPVIVGGRPEQRGVVSTCSYEARIFGVHSAMSLTEAYRRCPHGVFLDVDFSLYRHYSSTIMEIFRSYTPHVEVVSVDEAYIDVTEILQDHGGAVSLAKEMKQAVFTHTQLTCSIGGGSNKLIAKIAAGQSKPNGLKIIPHGEEQAFLEPLPVGTLPGVGEKTREFLHQQGIKKIQDLQELSLDRLLQDYGALGYHLFLSAHGKDDRPVDYEDSTPKSVGAEITFDKDTIDDEVLIDTLEQLVDKACRRMKRHRMRTRTVSLKLRYSNFNTLTRSHTLLSHTNRKEEILAELIYLFRKTYDNQLPVRLVGVSLEKLTDGYWQPLLWESINS